MKKFLAILLAALMLMAVLAGCGSKTEDKTTNSDSGEKTTTSDSGIDTVPVTEDGEPFVIRIGQQELGRLIEGVTPFECYPACTVIYDQIFRLDPWTKTPVSDCLKDWYWEDDNHLVMVLADGVTFSNGEKADAEDLLFSYKNHQDRGSSYTNDMHIDWDNCEIRDDQTFVMAMTDPNLTVFRQNISLYNKDWCEAQTGWDSEAFYNPVGSGPYYVEEFHYGDFLRLKPREDYWNKDFETPIVDEFYIKAYSDVSAMMMDLEMGNIDLCKATSADYSRYLKDPDKDSYDWKILPCQDGAIQYISFAYNAFDGLWRNEDLRRAIAHGIDLEALGIYLLGEDLYKPAYGFANENSPYFFDAGHYEYDPELAQEYLKKAGVDPTQMTIHADVMETATYKNYTQGVEYYLKEMGFNVQFDVADIPATLAAWSDPDGNDFNLFYNASGNTAYDVVSAMLNANKADGADFQRVDDEHFSELYVKCMDPKISDEERIELNHELQQYIWDHCLAIPVTENSICFAFNKNVFNDAIIEATHFSGYYQAIGFCQASAWEK